LRIGLASDRRVETTGGAVVGHADTASVAIVDIAALRPDAVTIDIVLKAGSGNPPVRVVLTNYTTDAHREAAQQLGADYFFDKAKEIREVLTVLESLSKPDSGTDHGSAIAA
jgi:DNA-binding NarL/FixJ family response regulator